MRSALLIEQRRWRRWGIQRACAFSFSLGLLVLASSVAAAQDGYPQRPELPLTGVPLLDDARRGQRQFEDFRHRNLPNYDGPGGGGANCDENVGRFCYWYNENPWPPPPEPLVIRAERQRLLALLDSAATHYPQDDWTAGQRVRYLAEDGQVAAELTAALECAGQKWWCSALVGFALHDGRQFVRADSAYAAGIKQMSQKLRCDWTDIGILLDEYTERVYRRLQCGTPEREQYENRLWQLSKPLYALPGMDTRTEFLARMTMSRMLQDAPSAHQNGFDIDERELLLRYSWPRAWALDKRQPGQTERGVVGMEPEPAYQFLPPATFANSPAMSDSADWENGVKPVHARYAPMYARKIKALAHQSALFQRGDSSLVVVAYDATNTPLGKSTKHQMSVVLQRADSLKPFITTLHDAPLRGVVIAKGPWANLLMSAEYTAAGVDTAVRARYGLRKPFAVGARVTMSELLFFDKYDGVPETLEEAAQHAKASVRVRNDQELGFYFESYGTNPAGEKLKVTVTVARVEDEPGFVERRMKALRLSKESHPTLLTFEDQSKLGVRTTPRGAYLNIKSLKKGKYIIQLEMEVNGQYFVRTEKTIEVIN